jgi:ribosomal protein S18 acetylase RimI-like enzyme
MLTCRSVRDADIATICKFPQSGRELFFMYPKASYPLTCKQLTEAIEERADSTVILSDNEVVGFANFYACEPSRTCTIGNVIVAPGSRGRGVGIHLIKTMVEIAFKKHKVKEALISCFNRNAAGLLLYQKVGFRPFTIEERQDDRGGRAALIHMRLCSGSYECT